MIFKGLTKKFDFDRRIVCQVSDAGFRGNEITILAELFENVVTFKGLTVYPRHHAPIFILEILWRNGIQRNNWS